MTSANICPSDPTNDLSAWNPDGSAAEEVSATGGTVATPDGNLELVLPENALPEATTISVTELRFNDPEADLALAIGPAKGHRIAVYDFEPDGQAFGEPVTLTLVMDVTPPIVAAPLHELADGRRLKGGSVLR